LTSTGWKNIKDVTVDDLVATFDKEKIYFEYPKATISKPVENFYKIEGQSTCQNVSGKHSVVLNDLSKIHAEDIKKLKDKDLPYGMIEEKESALNNDWLEVLTCVVMDGTIIDRSKYQDTVAKRIQFKISKPEKIEYIKSVLDKAGIEYTFKPATMSPSNKLQPYYIRIYGEPARKIFKMLNGVKELPFYYSDMDSGEFYRFIKCLEQTDGYRPNKNTIDWTTTSKSDVDIIQMAATLNGYLFIYKEVYGSGFKNGKLQYHCSIRKDITKNRNVTIEKSAGGMSYCLEMPAGRFVTRYAGKVAFSGNTAMRKFHNTDILRRIVYELNREPDTNIQLGDYSGWLNLKFNVSKTHSNSINVHYHHGFGGNAARSKGMLGVQIEAFKYPDANILVRGHTHQKWYDPSTTRVRLNSRGKVYKDKIRFIQSGSYVDGVADGKGGWVVEKNFNPTDIGGWFVNFTPKLSAGDVKIEVGVHETIHDTF
jgi:hypothetical protein